jgi:hypothetical protein
MICFGSQKSMEVRSLVVEADGIEDGLHAFADVVKFAVGDVLDSADIAAAEVVDDGVEAVAGVVVSRGVNFVAGFGADAAVLVVAVGEGDTSDLKCADGVGGVGGGLRGALVGGDVGGDAVVEESSAEGGVGMRVEADGGYGAHLGVVGSITSIEVEGADVAVFAGEVPGRRDGEGDAVACVVEWTGRRGVRFRSRFRGFALEEWWNGFRLAGQRLGWRLGQRGQSREESENGAGETLGEVHTFCRFFFDVARCQLA